MRQDQHFLDTVPSLKLIHHQIVRKYVIEGDIQLPPIKVSDDVKIVMVEDFYHCKGKNFLHVNIPPHSIHKICVEKYIKWITKVIELKNYIQTYYNEIPEFILYLDSFDTIAVNDIPSPKKILDFYNCRVLFNKEGNFGHDGCTVPSQEYYNDWLGDSNDKNSKLIYELYKIPNRIGLNAGMFIGYKDSLLSILQEMVEYHIQDFTKGFPYGSVDDQSLFRYMFLKYPDIIGLDVFSKLFTQAATPDFPSTDTNYFNYFCQFEENYLNFNLKVND